jgi:UDP-N-acetylglucosamine 2-epimerase (non-hydrolysing)
MKKILLVAGARPNFMKIAPVIDAFRKYNQSHQKGKNKISYRLVHTGQHYDAEMSDSFFRDLEIPSPDIYLGVGSGTHAEQSGRIMIEFEKVCRREKPDLVVVVGDVNSTVACALVAVKLSIAVAHIEAGLRSFDRMMPEEINRLMTDQISDFLFTTSEDADRNLLSEGIPGSKIYLVGNVMIDTLLKYTKIAARTTILKDLGLKDGSGIRKYAALTLHRPSNVDSQIVLKGILGALNKISETIPVIFPAHPRTAAKIKKFGMEHMLTNIERRHPLTEKGKTAKVWKVPPLGYLDFLNLMAHAHFVLTDSGGIQEETTILNIPCLTLRQNTERPVTTQYGTNIIVGNAPARIIEVSKKVMGDRMKRKRVPKYWDGRAAERIVDVLTN